MSSLFSTGEKSASKPPPATSLRIQSSLQGVPRAIGWGRNRISGNLIWYGDFVSSGQLLQRATLAGKGGGGGGGKGGGNNNAQTTYSAAVALAISEGPILVVDHVWNNTTPVPLSALNLTTFVGSYSQLPWGYLTTAHPDQALNYRGLAYVAAGPMSLGTNPQLPAMNFDVIFGINNGTGAYTGLVSQVDANAAAVVYDYLTNANYGVGFPLTYLDSLATYANYIVATGMVVSPVETSQRSASDFIKELLLGTNCAAVWSGGLLKIVPYGDKTITAGTNSTLTEQHVIPLGSVTNSYTYSIIIAGCPGNFVSDGGVKYAATGVSLALVGSNPAAGQYSRSGNTYTFNASEKGTLVNITYTYSAAATYTAPSAPLYDLTDDDFIPVNAEAPIEVTRPRISEQFNSIRVEYLDRSNDYNPVIVEAKDDASIALYGLRPKPTINMHYFAIAGAAQISAALLLGREAIRNYYVFTIPAKYILLDPMDIVSLTNTQLGLVRQWVRIIEIQENEDRTLTIHAEEYLQGTGNAPVYGQQAVLGPALNYNVPPGNVATPIIFEPGVQLAGGFEIWAAVCGANLSTWGGCYVCVSYDNVTYQMLPEPVVGNARMGVLTAPLAAQAGTPAIDNIHTLSVNLTMSAGQLTSGTVADLNALNALCYVDGEVLAFQTATPTATNRYNLTKLNRGAYGTQLEMNAGHSTGTSFARLDNSIIKIPFTADRIGQTMFIKFLSFNLYGGALQSLADVSPYSYVMSGEGATVIAPTAPSITSAFFQQPDGTLQPTLTVSWTASTDPVFDSYEIQLQISGTGTWDYSGIVNSQTLSFTAKQIVPSTFYDARVRAIRTTVSGNFYSAWVQVTHVATIFKTAGPNPPTGLVAFDALQQHVITWTNPVDTDFDHVQIWAADLSNNSASAVLWADGIKDTSWAEKADTPTFTNGPNRYFWLKAVNRTGIVSGFNATGVGSGQASKALVATTQMAGAGQFTIAGNSQSGAITGIGIGSYQSGATFTLTPVVACTVTLQAIAALSGAGGWSMYIEQNGTPGFTVGGVFQPNPSIAVAYNLLANTAYTFTLKLASAVGTNAVGTSMVAQMLLR